MKSKRTGLFYCKGLFKDFEHKIDKWDAPRERLFDGAMVKGRPSRGFGSTSFNYAGKLYEPEPWTTSVELIKTAAEDVAAMYFLEPVEFNFCLCGYYGKDGKGIPHHSDTVPTVDDIVVSISFGGPRIFVHRTYENPIKKHSNTSEISIKDPYHLSENFLVKETHYLLEHGDVIMFDGQDQMYSTHAVSDLEFAKERVNLTFRSGL